MTTLTDRLGDGIDAAWCSVGLDLDGFARRHPARARKIGIWMLAVGQTVGYGGLYYVFAAFLLTWDSSFPWGKELLTLAFMISILVGAAVSPFAGRMVDKGVSRWLLSAGMTLGAISLLVLGTVESYTLFVICWIGLGIAQGASLYEPCFAFVTRTTGEEAAKNIARITLAAGFASTIALPAGAFLADELGWRGAAWVFAAVVGLIGAPALYAGGTLIECCPKNTHSPEAASQDMAAYRAARARPEFWLIYLAFPLIGLAEGMVLIHIIPILTDAGLALSQAVFVAALFGPMQVVGRLAMMHFAGRVRSLTTAAFSFSGILCAVFLLMMVDDVPAAAYAFVVLFGSSFGVISILRPVVTYEVLGRTAFGKITGAMAVPFLVALAVSPQMGSYLWRVGGYDLALEVGAVIAVIALAVLFALITLLKIRRKQAQPN